MEPDVQISVNKNDIEHLQGDVNVLFTKHNEILGVMHELDKKISTFIDRSNTWRWLASFVGAIAVGVISWMIRTIMTGG